MKALILVDLQNDFLRGGPLAVPHGDEVIAIANRLQPLFDVIVATQDWHPPTHGSFASNHPGRAPGDVVTLGGQLQVLWPVHCVQETRGAAFAPALDTKKVTRIFPKGTDPEIDSYSGFFDNGHRKATGLGDFLHERGVTNVYVLGLATDYCVKATAIDARQLGFTTHLIADACRGVELKAGDIARAIDAMTNTGVLMTTSDVLLQENPAAHPTPPTFKFRKRQVIVEATEWMRPGDHFAVTHPVPPTVPIIENGEEIGVTLERRATLAVGAIKTLEGWMLVRPGDFIIRGVQGEFYACKPDIFLKTYERVDD